MVSNCTKRLNVQSEQWCHQNDVNWSLSSVFIVNFIIQIQRTTLLFFSIVIFDNLFIWIYFHGHWLFTWQQGKGGAIRSNISTRSRIFTHLFAVWHPRWRFLRIRKFSTGVQLSKSTCSKSSQEYWQKLLKRNKRNK